MQTAASARGDLGWMFRLLSALMTTLAVVALAQHGFVTWSLTAPMQLVMNAYNETMELLFGWAQPHLEAVVTWLGNLIGWRPTLYRHWRDFSVIFLIMTAFWFRAFRSQPLKVTLMAAGLGSLSLLCGTANPELAWVLLLGIAGFAAMTSLMNLTTGLVFGSRFNIPVRHNPYVFQSLTVLGGFAGAFCFFAIDAGLKLLGA